MAPDLAIPTLATAARATPGIGALSQLDRSVLAMLCLSGTDADIGASLKLWPSAVARSRARIVSACGALAAAAFELGQTQ